MTTASFSMSRNKSNGGSFLCPPWVGCALCLAVILAVVTKPQVLAAPPANDNFADRITLGNCTTVTATNVDATKETGEPNHASTEGGVSVWWTWTAPVSGRVTITTAGSDFDTLLAVYTGASVNNLSEIASNDDDGWELTSRVSFNAIAGTTYQIAVDGYYGETGYIELFLTQAAANDRFADSIAVVGCPAVVGGTNLCATKESGEPNHAGNAGGASLWWRWTAPSSGNVTITTAGSNFDTLLAVYTGESVENLTEIASNDNDGASQTSRVSFAAVAGTTYQIAVDGANGATGAIALNVGTTADLVVQSFTLNKSSYVPREIGTATVTVKNQGVASTGSTYFVDLLRHAPDTVGCNPTTYYKRISRPALAAGATDTFSISYVNYAGLGDFVCRMAVNSTCAVPECDLSNNQATVSYAVIAAPDLVVQSLSLNKSGFRPAEIGTVTIAIKNQGIASTDTGYFVDILRHAPSTVGCSPTKYYKRINRPALAASQTDTFTVPYVNYVGTGSFTFRVFADSTCVVAESNETNNQASVSYSVSTAPDLVVESFTLNKSSYAPREIGTATIVIKNNGATSTGEGFAVDLIRHALLPVDCNPTNYYKRINRPALAAGQTDTFTVPYVNYAGAGSFTFRVFVDSTCVITESNENNNQASQGYSVAPTDGAPLSNSGTPDY